MSKYEIHIMGENNPFYSFESSHAFVIGDRIFIKKDEKIYSVVVGKVTHDLTKEAHIIRLNSNFKKMFS